MFLKPTYDELYNHFKTIAESVPETPMLLYNNPGRVGYTLSAKLVEELAHNVPNIIGMKDTSGDITQTSEFIRRTRDVDFKVFGGKDTLLYASLCHGAVGGVCTAANFMPELITDVYNKYAAGDLAGSLEAQFKLNPVRRRWMRPASRWLQRIWPICAEMTWVCRICLPCPPRRVPQSRVSSRP